MSVSEFWVLVTFECPRPASDPSADGWPVSRQLIVRLKKVKKDFHWYELHKTKGIGETEEEPKAASA